MILPRLMGLTVLLGVTGTVIGQGTPDPCPETFENDPTYGCFHRGVESATWFEAFYYCSEIGGYMMEIRDEAHMGWALETLDGNYWIGLTDFEGEGNFSWTQSGKPTNDFSAWATNQPNGSANENCVAMTQENYGFWSDEDCIHTILGPLCQAPTQLSPCGPDDFYSRRLNKCYRGVYEPSDFIGARGNCSLINGQLPEVLSQSMSDTLEEAMLFLGILEMWIGLSDEAEEGQFLWVNSGLDTSGFSHFSPNSANDPMHEFNCVYKTYFDEFKWLVQRCANPWPFICTYEPLDNNQ